MTAPVSELLSEARGDRRPSMIGYHYLRSRLRCRRLRRLVNDPKVGRLKVVVDDPDSPKACAGDPRDRLGEEREEGLCRDAHRPAKVGCKLRNAVTDRWKDQRRLTPSPGLCPDASTTKALGLSRLSASLNAITAAS